MFLIYIYLACSLFSVYLDKGDVFDLGTEFVRHLDVHAKLLAPTQAGPDMDWSAGWSASSLKTIKEMPQ